MLLQQYLFLKTNNETSQLLIYLYCCVNTPQQYYEYLEKCQGEKLYRKLNMLNILKESIQS